MFLRVSVHCTENIKVSNCRFNYFPRMQCLQSNSLLRFLMLVTKYSWNLICLAFLPWIRLFNKMRWLLTQSNSSMVLEKKGEKSTLLLTYEMKGLWLTLNKIFLKHVIKNVEAHLTNYFLLPFNSIKWEPWLVLTDLWKFDISKKFASKALKCQFCSNL